jgi:phosphoenolpyruvate phosphomutase
VNDSDNLVTPSRDANGRAQVLRALLDSPRLGFLMEAHDALSAAVVQRCGFEGLWASGLSIASSLGFRDANEASWTQVVEVVERMADVTNIPILVDGDSGFGNFNNARLAALKLYQRGAAGICIEDKAFPKMNSFIGGRHALADIAEFSGRLRAVRDTVPTSKFVLVARIEALIAGHGHHEALRRAHAYCEAGADAILIHSRRSTAEEVLTFARDWGNRLPVIIVPTKYYATPVQAYRDAGISVVIWANHAMRASVSAMREVCRRIRDEQGIAGVEGQVATLDEVFDLMRYSELASAEERYLPAQGTNERA